MTRVSIPRLLWYGDKQLTPSFNARWDVKLYPMDGERTRPLNWQEIKSSFSNPIGSKRIGDMAKERKEGAILFDDMSRPTKRARRDTA